MLLEEKQDIGAASAKVVSASYVDEQDRSQVIYPDGSTNVTFTYDERDRVDSISYNSTEVAHYDFMGYRLLERTYDNGTKLRYHNGSGSLTGYDAHRRPVLHENRNTGDLASFSYSWDRADNRLSEDGTPSLNSRIMSKFIRGKMGVLTGGASLLV